MYRGFQSVSKTRRPECITEKFQVKDGAYTGAFTGQYGWGKGFGSYGGR
jgi:hypothetical protein